MVETLQCLKRHGERLDSELAKELGIPIAMVRENMARLAAAGEVITCSLTRYEEGKETKALLCRVAGYVPPRTPGRKPNPTS